MRFKLVLILGAVITVVGVGGIAWRLAVTPKALVLLRSLSPVQRSCVEEIVGSGTLAIVEPQEVDGSLAIGYLVDKDYYTSILSIRSSGSCHSEFKAKAFDCYDEYQVIYCRDSDYRVEPRRIQKVELSDDLTPYVYVWFDVFGLGVRGGAHHSFYVEQADGSGKLVLALKLCVGLSSLRIDGATHMVSALDDVVCDMFHGRKEHIDYSLIDGMARKLSDWFDP